MIYSNSRKTALHFMFIDLPGRQQQLRRADAPRPHTRTSMLPGRAPRAQAEPSILHAHRIILLPLVDEESAVLFDQPLVSPVFFFLVFINIPSFFDSRPQTCHLHLSRPTQRGTALLSHPRLYAEKSPLARTMTCTSMETTLFI